MKAAKSNIIRPVNVYAAGLIETRRYLEPQSSSRQKFKIQPKTVYITREETR